jgi:predicted secreted Zn-dependent protease
MLLAPAGLVAHHPAPLGGRQLDVAAVSEAPSLPAAVERQDAVYGFARVDAPPIDGSGAGGPLIPGVSSGILATDSPGPSDEQAATARPLAVQVTSATSFYEVDGADIRTLLASLRQRGPSDGRQTWAASTSWVFRWAYQPILDATCRVQAARVDLDLTYVFPAWNAPTNAAPAVASTWEGYLARVELHEHGHRDIAQAAANDLARALEALPGQASCEALAEAARAAATELLARHAQTQIAYDRETGHGATQGAVLRE